jgi:hypothetical protein
MAKLKSQTKLETPMTKRYSLGIQAFGFVWDLVPGI